MFASTWTSSQKDSGSSLHTNSHKEVSTGFNILKILNRNTFGTGSSPNISRSKKTIYLVDLTCVCVQIFLPTFLTFLFRNFLESIFIEFLKLLRFFEAKLLQNFLSARV